MNSLRTCLPKNKLNIAYLSKKQFLRWAAKFSVLIWSKRKPLKYDLPTLALGWEQQNPVEHFCLCKHGHESWRIKQIKDNIYDRNQSSSGKIWKAIRMLFSIFNEPKICNASAHSKNMLFWDYAERGKLNFENSWWLVKFCVSWNFELGRVKFCIILDQCVKSDMCCIIRV